MLVEGVPNGSRCKTLSVQMEPNGPITLYIARLNGNVMNNIGKTFKYIRNSKEEVQFPSNMAAVHRAYLCCSASQYDSF